MKAFLKILTSLLAILFIYQSSVLGQKTEISGTIIAGPTISLISLSVDDFKMSDSLLSTIDTVFASDLKHSLINDLMFTLYFNVVIPDSTFLADFIKGDIKLDDWIYLGAQMLVQGRIEKREDLYTVSIQVIDVFRNNLVYNNEFLGSIQNYRSLSHRIAADLLFNLTGEEGVFDTKIVYSSKVNGNRDIYICDFDGYNSIRITDDLGLDQMPAWSHNGDRAYFTSDRPDRSSHQA